MIDAKAFGAEIAGIMKAQTAPLLLRIEELEEALREKPAEFDYDKAASLAAGKVSKQVEKLQSMVEAIPAPAEAPELPDIAALVADAVAGLPAPPDARSIAVDHVLPEVKTHLAELVADLPKAQPGADGVGIAGAFIDRNGELTVTLTDGETRALGPIVGKDADPDLVAQTVMQEIDERLKAIESVAGRTPELPDIGKLIQAELPDIAAIVADAVAKLPAPPDARSIAVDHVLPEVKTHLAELVANLPKAQPGADGVGIAGAFIDRNGELTVTLTDGETRALGPIVGKDADPELVAQTVMQEIDERLRAIEVASASTPELPDFEKLIQAELPDIAALVADAVAGLPAPPDGKSIAVDHVLPEVKAHLAELVAHLPKAQPGADGVGIAGAFIDRNGELTVTLTDGETRALGPIVGKDGDPGIGFDDLDILHDGEREFTFRFQRGAKIIERMFTLPVMLDRGVYSEGKDYGTGDVVSFGGSMWVAQKETGERPGTGDGWRLSVKKGRDGKPGELKEPVKPKPVKVG